jgi:hypothetical protein
MSTATLDKDAEIKRLREELFDTRVERDKAEYRAHNAGVMAGYYSDGVQRAQSLVDTKIQDLAEKDILITDLYRELDGKKLDIERLLAENARLTALLTSREQD